MKKWLEFFLVFILILFGSCQGKSVEAKFSSVEEIGSIGYVHEARQDGIIVVGGNNVGENIDAVSDFEADATGVSNVSAYSYKKGIVRFGDEGDALFCQYDISREENRVLKFGGKSEVVSESDGTYKTIFRLRNDAGAVFYFIFQNLNKPGVRVIGRQKNGAWEIYLDTDNLNQVVYDDVIWGEHGRYMVYERPYIDGEAIVMPYKFYNKSYRKLKAEGEIRLFWNSEIQAFGIDRRKYQNERSKYDLEEKYNIHRHIYL